ncbi:MAG: glucokinase [Bdellovibrio bacteriovorus]
MRILVGDIGGTKTGLALAEVAGGRVTLREERRYPSGDFDGLEAIVARYLKETGQGASSGSPRGAFAIAGPVQGRRSRTTNLPWDVDADRLERVLGLERVGLLNDLEAVAWGVAALGPSDLLELHAGEPGAAGNACVVAAGTGLGEAGLFWDGERHWPFATEGGHTDFAPVDEREFALLKHLQGRFGRVSWERVASGMGIANIYGFLLEWHEVKTPEWLVDAIAEGDTAAAVAGAAAAGRCPICAETMELFFHLYGREAGNMGLKHMALGGVYLGGGIAPKNLRGLQEGPFLRGFFAKGRMEPLMRRMPVRVILRGDTPLLGCARFMSAER